MKILRFILSISFYAILIATNCSDDSYSPPSDPQKAILGKWIEIEIGNFPDMIKEQNPGWYCEYKTDSIKLYHFSDSEIYQNKYWIDSLYHERTIINNGPSITEDFKYFFYDDKLRLESTFSATYTTAIFRKIL